MVFLKDNDLTDARSFTSQGLFSANVCSSQHNFKARRRASSWRSCLRILHVLSTFACTLLASDSLRLTVSSNPCFGLAPWHNPSSAVPPLSRTCGAWAFEHYQEELSLKISTLFVKRLVIQKCLLRPVTQWRPLDLWERIESGFCPFKEPKEPEVSEHDFCITCCDRYQQWL